MKQDHPQSEDFLLYSTKLKLSHEFDFFFPIQIFDDLPHFHYAFINTPYKGVVHGYINRK